MGEGLQWEWAPMGEGSNGEGSNGEGLQCKLGSNGGGAPMGRGSMGSGLQWGRGSMGRGSNGENSNGGGAPMGEGGSNGEGLQWGGALNGGGSNGGVSSSRWSEVGVLGAGAPWAALLSQDAANPEQAGTVSQEHPRPPPPPTWPPRALSAVPRKASGPGLTASQIRGSGTGCPLLPSAPRFRGVGDSPPPATPGPGEGPESRVPWQQAGFSCWERRRRNCGRRAGLVQPMR